MFRLFRHQGPVALAELRQEAATPYGAVWSCSLDGRRQEEAAGGEIRDDAHRLAVGDVLVLRDRENPRSMVKLRVTGRDGGHVHAERLRDR
jgi:hypothetical protein